MRISIAVVMLIAMGGAVCCGWPRSASAYDGYDGAYADAGCYGDSCDGGDCYGEGCYSGDCYGECGPDGCGAGHGGRHGLHGLRGPCYWWCCNSGCDLTCPCYGGCGCCDAGYMLPVRRAQWYNWNRNYAYTDYGQPTVLVTPPTAILQTNYGWGVASSRITRNDHQFQRNYPGGGPFGGGFGGPFRPTPVWPSDTSQFGVYYVRGPW